MLWIRLLNRMIFGCINFIHEQIGCSVLARCASIKERMASCKRLLIEKICHDPRICQYLVQSRRKVDCDEREAELEGPVEYRCWQYYCIYLMHYRIPTPYWQTIYAPTPSETLTRNEVLFDESPDRWRRYLPSKSHLFDYSLLRADKFCSTDKHPTRDWHQFALELRQIDPSNRYGVNLLRLCLDDTYTQKGKLGLDRLRLWQLMFYDRAHCGAWLWCRLCFRVDELLKLYHDSEDCKVLNRICDVCKID